MQHKIVYQRPALIRKQEPIYNFRIVNKSISQPLSQPARQQPQAIPPKPALRQQAIQRTRAVIRYTNAKELTFDGQQKVLALKGTGRGRILVILGNGPSLATIDTSPLKSLQRVDTLSINHPDLRIWPTTYWAFCDMSQYNRHQEHWINFEGTILTGTFLPHTKPNVIKFRPLGGEGFSLNLVDGYYVGRSTVYAMLQVAAYADYDMIFILGCDMSMSPDGRVWFYGQNPDVKLEHRVPRFDKEAAYYEYAGNQLPQYIRDKFYFCSSYNPYSFPDRFHRIRHEEAINYILSVI